MWAPISHASSCSTRAYASARLTLPARMDLISVPVRTSPASKVSSIVKSCRARRLRATVCSSPTVACSFERVARRTNAGPISGRRPVAEPPAGCSVLDGQLLDPIADILGDGVVERRRGRVREAGQADVADRSVGQRLCDDLALNDDVAGDRKVERRRLRADDAQGDRRAALAADFVARLVDREPVELRAVDG